MQRSRYDEYIARFNAEDPTAFDEFIAPDMKMLNGALEFEGVEGMRDHYENKMWPFFHERLHILRFVSDETCLAVQMWTNFTAKRDAETIFGPVVEGEQFDFRGLIMYDIRAGRFTRIVVSYNSFANTRLDGRVIEMGVPH
jgi:hypothetical protein